jgi:hypothetical protein
MSIEFSNDSSNKIGYYLKFILESIQDNFFDPLYNVCINSDLS